MFANTTMTATTDTTIDGWTVYAIINTESHGPLDIIVSGSEPAIYYERKVAEEQFKIQKDEPGADVGLVKLDAEIIDQQV